MEPWAFLGFSAVNRNGFCPEMAWDGSDRDVGGRASAGLPYFWLAVGRGGGSSSALAKT